MSLKLKAAIIIMGIFFLLGIVDFSIRKYIIFPSFLSLERENAVENAIRIQEAFNSEVQHLDRLLHDWSAWDDTYEFIQNDNEDYIKANLAPSTMESNRLNMLYFTAEDGHIVWGGTNGLAPDAERKLKEFLGVSIGKGHPLRNYDTKNTPLPDIRTTGLFSTPAGFLIVSSRPVLTTVNKGPARGAIIMGTLIDDDFINRISGQIKLSLSRYVQPDSAIESKLTRQLSDNKFAYLIETEEPRTNLNIYTAIRDITGKNKLMLKAHRPRKIVQTGYAATLYATISFLATMISALVVMILLIHLLVVKPVLRLKDNVISAKVDNQRLPALVRRPLLRADLLRQRR
jgi:sensor domain CHASE-containing protein